jgi:hypothetical protein
VDSDGQTYVVDQDFKKVDVFRPAALPASAHYGPAAPAAAPATAQGPAAKPAAPAATR